MNAITAVNKAFGVNSAFSASPSSKSELSRLEGKSPSGFPSGLTTYLVMVFLNPIFQVWLEVCILNRKNQN